MIDYLDLKQARRLALVSAGLSKPRWNELPSRARGRSARARKGALRVIDHFGYLQLDTISIAGVRSHALVLLSRLDGLDPTLPEDLLKPRQPLFEYWGHEACWMPLDLYPCFEFRRRRFRRHPWWGDLLEEHADVARNLLARIEAEGPLRSIDLEGERAAGMWNLKLTRRVADALWSCGQLAIRERRRFQIQYDLRERVIPPDLIDQKRSTNESIKTLVLRAAQAHGWATKSTLASTWRLRNMARQIKTALAELEEDGSLLRCDLRCEIRTGGRTIQGWITQAQREQAERLLRMPLSRERAVLLSPFDPVLWDRDRVQQLFGFHQVLEIYKPAADRLYGYYCLPILVGEKLVGRCDLKAHRKAGRLEVRCLHYEEGASERERQLSREAIERHAERLELLLDSALG